ncbi:MAG: DUF721 domain-containing protein [Rikenellaceae bacterium]
MRRTKPVRIGELWADFLKDTPLIAAKIAEAKLPEYWAEIVGPAVASYTPSMNLHKGVLYINVSSSVVRHEILIRRETLRHSLNEKMGFRLINSIIVK